MRPSLIVVQLPRALRSGHGAVHDLERQADEQERVLPVLRAVFGQVFAAATTLCLIPVAILLVFQRYFIRSVSASGLKE